MKTLPAEAGAAAAPTLLVFVDEAGRLGRWLLLVQSGVVDRGDASDGLPATSGEVVLAVPGEQLTLHWIELAAGLAPAQAAAAARLMLADASAEPLAGLHVAVGRPEAALTPVAMVPIERMADWIGAAEAAGFDPIAIVPGPLLLPPPESGFVRHDRGELGDYRGPAAAFSLEPELAEPLVAGSPVEAFDEAAFEAALPPLLAALPLDLRQGAFARRRRLRLESGRLRRVAILTLALAALTLAVQIANILAHTFAADRAQAEADALHARARVGGADARPGFGATAAILFAAVRDTPNVELARIEYRADGSLSATVMLDNLATLEPLRARVEAAGLRIEAGETRSAGGRPAADVTVGPA